MPSAVKTKRSVLFAVVVSVGLKLYGQRTVPGHVAVRLPVPSCLRNRVKLRPAVGVGKVKVQLPVMVMNCTVPLAKLIVYAVLLLAVTVSSV